MAERLQLPRRLRDRALPGSRKERGSTSICNTREGGDEKALSADLDGVRSGEEGAFRRIIDEFSPLVFNVALGVTQSEADAEDVLQEVLIRLPEALATFRGGHFPAWLKKVAARQALMWMRAEARHQRKATPFVRRDRVEEQTLSRIVIDRAVAQLDPSLRTVYVLKEMEGLSHAEIAEIMGITVNLSEVRLFRARAALRAIIEPS